MSHRPRKRFGQNFLQSQPMISAIIQAMHLQTDDNVIEIGPGLGALTRPLLTHVQHLTAIEIDRDLQASLSNLPEAQRLTLICDDALSVDYNQFGKDLRLIGNLPYNISTPLLLHLLQFLGSIQDMHFMLQKEVVNRLAAVPGTKAFGRLSVMVQYHCDVTALLDVPPSAFYPQPKVDSAVVRLGPYAVSPFPAVTWSALERLVACAFGMRRKTLANNLKPLFTADQIRSIGIDPTLRPEQLSLTDYGLLTSHLSQQTFQDKESPDVLP